VDLKAFQEFLKKATRTGSWWLSLAGNSKEETDPGLVVNEQEIRAELGRCSTSSTCASSVLPQTRAISALLGWSILMRRR